MLMSHYERTTKQTSPARYLNNISQQTLSRCKKKFNNIAFSQFYKTLGQQFNKVG